MEGAYCWIDAAPLRPHPAPGASLRRTGVSEDRPGTACPRISSGMADFLSRRTAVCWPQRSPGLREQNKNAILPYAFVFPIIALIAGFFGFFSLAGLAGTIAKILLIIFVILFIISLITGRRRI